MTWAIRIQSLSISLKAHDFCRKNGLVTEMYHGLNAIIDVYINRKDYKRADYYIQMMRQKIKFVYYPKSGS